MQKEVKGYWGPVTHRQDASAGSETKKGEFSNGIDQLSESL